MKNKEFYPKFKKFDKDNIFYINLPKPIPNELYVELYNKGILPKKELVENKYYFGNCRNANVAKWNGDEFVYMRHKFGSNFPETINHFEDDDGYDLFIPLHEIEPNDDQIIK